MSRFYVITREKLEEIRSLLNDRDPRQQVLLDPPRNGFADVVRYNSRYDTAVVLTVRVEEIPQ